MQGLLLWVFLMIVMCGESLAELIIMWMGL